MARSGLVVPDSNHGPITPHMWPWLCAHQGTSAAWVDYFCTFPCSRRCVSSQPWCWRGTTWLYAGPLGRLPQVRLPQVGVGVGGWGCVAGWGWGWGWGCVAGERPPRGQVRLPRTQAPPARPGLWAGCLRFTRSRHPRRTRAPWAGPLGGPLGGLPQDRLPLMGRAWPGKVPRMATTPSPASPPCARATPAQSKG